MPSNNIRDIGSDEVVHGVGGKTFIARKAPDQSIISKLRVPNKVALNIVYEVLRELKGKT